MVILVHLDNKGYGHPRSSSGFFRLFLPQWPLQKCWCNSQHEVNLDVTSVPAAITRVCLADLIAKKPFSFLLNNHPAPRPCSFISCDLN